jgi:2-dehydro-3-deoxyphosphogluconate aldolase/(4S)-4-hydroxy-2-oxoglutarate aldolase
MEGEGIVIEKLSNFKIVPVVKIDRASDAEPLAEALIQGGLPLAEVTFRTEAAVDAIINMKKKSEIIVGAGTITTLKQARVAFDIGCEFIVTPGFSREITEFALENKIPIFPGVCTPTEMMYLIEYNLTLAKFFPSEQFGGVSTIKALSAPFPNIKFMPTGGINANNIMKYLEIPQIVACGGSWMVKDTLINSGQFKEIEMLTQKALELVK